MVKSILKKRFVCMYVHTYMYTYTGAMKRKLDPLVLELQAGSCEFPCGY